MAQNILQVGTAGVILILIFWTGIQPSVSSQRSSLRSGYNENCNKTIKCKSQSWFTCDAETEKCGCLKPDEMTYDANKGKCLVLVGERCKFGFEEDAVNSWYEKAECVSGAVCSPSGVCTCPSGTYEDAEQVSCHPVKGYGEPCSSKRECNQDKMLSCVNGTCGCDPDAAIYNPTSYEGYDTRYGRYPVPSDICVGRVGASCARQESKFCVWNAECSNNVCQCRSSYSTTSEMLCGRGHQESCTTTNSSPGSGNVCSDHFICSGTVTTRYGKGDIDIGSKCLCPNPGYQEYDSVSKSCRGLVGSPCDPTQSDSCTREASCVERDNVFQCECDEGYIVTEGWKCQQGFGSPCSHIGNRMRIEESCDEVPSLRCIRGTCSCPNAVDVYEEDKRKCSVPVGLACRETSECVTNAVCDNPTGNKFPGPGRCVCSNGFQMRKNQTCEAEESQDGISPTLQPKE